MKRKIIHIDEERCNGCGLCATACHEGAIDMVNGKARLLREDYCDGLGDCLPVCPTGAITFEEREAPAYARGNARDGGLSNWPVQIRLAPVNAPCFQGADLLIAADCTAFACGDFHQRFLRGRVALIGCPKLDEGDYAVKLSELFTQGDIRSVTVARMEVPCCGGMERAVRRAIEASGKAIPCRVAVLSTEGRELA